MKIVNKRRNLFVPFIAVALISLGCSTLNPESQSAESAAVAENVVEIRCGARTFGVQIDKRTPEQKEELEELNPRCRIDNVAHRLETQSGLDWKTEDHEIVAKRPAGL